MTITIHVGFPGKNSAFIGKAQIIQNKYATFFNVENVILHSNFLINCKNTLNYFTGLNTPVICAIKSCQTSGEMKIPIDKLFLKTDGKNAICES